MKTNTPTQIETIKFDFRITMRSRKRNSNNSDNLNNSADDMMLNAKNLEVLLPDKYDALVNIQAEKQPENLFINPAHILQLFHDQNARIKSLEQKLENQEKIILANKSNNESNSLDDSGTDDLDTINLINRIRKCERTIDDFGLKLRNVESTELF